MLSHGDGYRVWDIDHNEYIDASSLTALCGYAHKEILEAIGTQLHRLHGIDLSVGSHEQVGLLAERLAFYLQEPLAKTLFVNSGSEGFEAAVLIAASYWAHQGQPRSRIVSFARSYHGSTLVGRSLSRLPRVDHPLRISLEVTRVELTATPRELRREEQLLPLVSAFEKAIKEPSNSEAMAVVVEPFLNVGGGVVLPSGFLRQLREVCDAAGTILIVDEVFTGYGRTGRMFAYQHEDVVPDILVSSKSLSSGYVPIAAVTVKDYIYESFRKDPVIGGLRYGHTTSGHAVACSAALATLDVLVKHGLIQKAEYLGDALLERLEKLEGVSDVIDVRRTGLVLVLETPSVDAASRIVSRAQQAGLLLRQQGPAVLIVPPLIIDEEGISIIADLFDKFML